MCCGGHISPRCRPRESRFDLVPRVELAQRQGQVGDPVDAQAKRGGKDGCCCGLVGPVGRAAAPRALVVSVLRTCERRRESSSSSSPSLLSPPTLAPTARSTFSIPTSALASGRLEEGPWTTNYGGKTASSMDTCSKPFYFISRKKRDLITTLPPNIYTSCQVYYHHKYARVGVKLL